MPNRCALRGLVRLETRLAPATFNIANGDVSALIAAITTSNANNQPDTINLANGGTYTFTAPAETATALPTILRDTNSDANTLTINGNGSSLLRSSSAGTPEFRFINIGAFPENVTVAISDVRFANGRVSTDNGGAIRLNDGSLTGTNLIFAQNSAASGGGIYTSVTDLTLPALNLANCTFTGNSATNGAGGGAYFGGSETVTLSDCTFTSNTSSAEGGGLRLFMNPAATVAMTRCFFSLNVANGGNGGGGCFAQSNTTIAESTFDNNTSAIGGGGLFHQGPLSVSRSTFSNNGANAGTANGGGLFQQGDLTLTNCTIDSNRAGNGGGLAYVNGGTIASISFVTITNNRAYFPIAQGGGVNITGSDFRLSNSVVAGNFFEPTVTLPAGPDVYGPVNSEGYNFVGIGDGAAISGVTTGNQVGTTASPLNPQLAALANNGGPTQTRLPQAGSPLLNAGDPAFSPPPVTDQRGQPRVSDGRVDIGSVEVTGPNVQSVQINDGAAQRSRLTSLTVTFNTIVSYATTPTAAFALTATGGRPVSFTAISGVVNGVTVAVLSSFTGLDAEFGSLRDGKYTLYALHDQISAGGQPINGGVDYSFGEAQGLFRFYGDMNGDRRVDISDFGFFSLSYLNPANYNSALDFNNDGRIDIADFGQFSVRYFTTLP